MDTSAFDSLMASRDAPMAIVTTCVDGERAGCLVGFHGQSSIEPRRYSVWLSKANHTFRVALHAEHLGVHLLTEADRDLAELFGTNSGDDVDKFALCDWGSTPEGVPALTRCPNMFVGRRTGLFDDGGDHVCFVTEPVVVLAAGAFVPLWLSDVDDLTPGHDVQERPSPPTERASDPA